ncbi:retrotransposon protein, putative, ty1-copia subclass [Tanacetum coccineum]
MDGNLHTYKANLVAKGFFQTYGVDYKETFSPVADIKAIRIIIVVVAFYDYEIWKMDVNIVFLNRHLSEEVYMVQPEGFVNPKYPNQVCMLKRSIYGLKQASRQSNKQFNDEIKKFGFTQNRDEPCLSGILFMPKTSQFEAWNEENIVVIDSANMFDLTKVGGGNTGPVSKRVGSSGLKCFNYDNGVADDEYEEHPVFDDDQYEKEIASGDVEVNLMVSRSCLTPKTAGDDWLKHIIFQSTCTILGKVCTFVVNPGSCDNLIAEEAVQKLGLKA